MVCILIFQVEATQQRLSRWYMDEKRGKPASEGSA
jgi:hypothetical protein